MNRRFLGFGIVLLLAVGLGAGWRHAQREDGPALPTIAHTVHAASPSRTALAGSAVDRGADGAASEQDLSESNALPEFADGADALDVHLRLLREGRDRLLLHSDHVANFHRQVRVGGVMLDPELCEVRVRHEPFSVHMEWMSGDKGRRAIYVDGANDGRMLVRLGGWKARLPPLKLEPDGSTAMRRARYPITCIGLAALADRLIEDREQDLFVGDAVDCRFTRDVTWNDRPCHEFVVTYATRSVTPAAATYRKSIQCIDRETGLPVLVRSYGWLPGDEPVGETELDEQTLLEVYAYTDVRIGTGLGEHDFDIARRK